MTLPEVQHRLEQLARELACPELRVLAGEIRRRSSRPGPITSRPMSAEVAAEIRDLDAQHPGWSQQQIARRVGVNPGRVSEVLHGYRQ